jgi:16S rRNA C967 or C1407 C5-methylase (RsmB/RsmF family)
MIKDFLHRHPEFKTDSDVPMQLEKYISREGFAQILPGDENMDGFFIARLRRL